jgi:CRP-like cAMP-binding protein
MVKRKSSKARFPVGFSGNASNGDGIHNEILRALPPSEWDLVFPELQLIDLRSQHRLTEAGATIQSGWFPNNGLASVLSVMRDGKSVEVGLTGKEGFVGLPLVVGLRTSANRVVMQVAGSGLRVSRASLARLLSQCPQLARSLNLYAQELGLQSAQAAACNRLHEVEQRLARWLLMSQDRLGGDVVPLTQESLAQMLGTRRASVTVAAGILQRESLIKYARGKIVIANRDRLVARACECYGIMVRQSRNWRNEAR